MTLEVLSTVFKNIQQAPRGLISFDPPASSIIPSLRTPNLIHPDLHRLVLFRISWECRQQFLFGKHSEHGIFFSKVEELFSGVSVVLVQHRRSVLIACFRFRGIGCTKSFCAFQLFGSSHCGTCGYFYGEFEFPHAAAHKGLETAFCGSVLHVALSLCFPSFGSFQLGKRLCCFKSMDGRVCRCCVDHGLGGGIDRSA